jgi:membrane protease YdiL (CAAX protease family)
LILPHFEKLSQSYSELMQEMMTGNPILLFITVAILAPISEELIFRGVIMKKAGSLVPFAAANLIQALLFGVAHMNIVQGVYAFAAGLVMGYTAHKFKSVKASMVLHILFNASSFIMISPTTEVMRYVYASAGAVLILIALLLISRVKELPQLQNITPVPAQNQAANP